MRHIWNATKALKQSIKFTLIIHMQSADLATGPESHPENPTLYNKPQYCQFVVIIL